MRCMQVLITLQVWVGINKEKKKTLLVSFIANSSSVSTVSGRGASVLKFFDFAATATGARHCSKICERLFFNTPQNFFQTNPHKRSLIIIGTDNRTLVFLTHLPANATQWNHFIEFLFGDANTCIAERTGIQTGSWLITNSSTATLFQHFIYLTRMEITHIVYSRYLMLLVTIIEQVW